MARGPLCVRGPKEDGPVEIATRRILANLAWIGLIVAGPLLAQEAIAPMPPSFPEVVPMGPPTPAKAKPTEATAKADAGQVRLPPVPDGIVGEQESGDPIFGGPPPAGCGICGGGDCLPSPWSASAGIRFMTRGRARPIVLTSDLVEVYSLAQVGNSPSGGSSTSVDSYYFIVKELPGLQVMATSSGSFNTSPVMDLKLTRYLGRDANSRDQFVDFEFWGLGKWRTSASNAGVPHNLYNPLTTDNTLGENAVGGSSSLFYYNSARLATNHYTPDIVLDPSTNNPVLRDSLTSPFVLIQNQPNSDNQIAGNVGNQANTLTLATADPAARSVDAAFNHAQQQSITYTSTFNNFEVDRRFDTCHHEDHMTLDPNGRWYRRCEGGFHFTYLYGLRAMILDEGFDYYSRSVVQYQDPTLPADTPPAIGAGRGQYSVRTTNDMFGLELGTQLSYEICRWKIDLSLKGGPCLNFAKQTSHLTTDLPDFVANELTLINNVITPTPIEAHFNHQWNASKVATAAFGELEFATSYKFRPNLIGHASYDFLWLGGVALAPEQLVFQTNPARIIDAAGATLFHGLQLELEYTW